MQGHTLKTLSQAFLASTICISQSFGWSAVDTVKISHIKEATTNPGMKSCLVSSQIVGEIQEGIYFTGEEFEICGGKDFLASRRSCGVIRLLNNGDFLLRCLESTGGDFTTEARLYITDAAGKKWEGGPVFDFLLSADFVSPSGKFAFLPNKIPQQAIPLEEAGLGDPVTLSLAKRDGKKGRAVKGFEGRIHGVSWDQQDKSFLVQTEEISISEGAKRLMSQLKVIAVPGLSVKTLPYEFETASLKPQLSPKGTYVAIGQRAGLGEELTVLNINGEAVSHLSLPKHAEWLDDTHLLVSAYEGDHFALFVIDVEANTTTRLPKTSSSGRFHVGGGVSVSFIEASLDRTQRVFVLSSNSIGQLMAGDFQWEQLEDIVPEESLGLRTETVAWESPDKTHLRGTLVYPEGYKEGHSYPVVVLLPESPQIPSPTTFIGSVSEATRRSPALYALNGYMVFMPSLRGSYVYNEEAHTRSVGTLAKEDAEDVLAGLRHLDAKGVTRLDQVSLVGKGYGGTLAFMMSLTAPDIRSVSMSSPITSWPLHAAEAKTDSMPREWLGSMTASYKEWIKASPAYNVQNIRRKVPMYIDFTEAEDENQGKLLAYVLQRFHMPVEAYSLSMQGGIPRPDSVFESLNLDLAFIQKHNPSSAQ